MSPYPSWLTCEALEGFPSKIAVCVIGRGQFSYFKTNKIALTSCAKMQVSLESILRQIHQTVERNTEQTPPTSDLQTHLLFEAGFKLIQCR